MLGAFCLLPIKLLLLLLQLALLLQLLSFQIFFHPLPSFFLLPRFFLPLLLLTRDLLPHSLCRPLCFLSPLLQFLDVPLTLEVPLLKLLQASCDLLLHALAYLAVLGARVGPAAVVSHQPPDRRCQPPASGPPLSVTSLRTAVVSHQPPDRRCQPPASGPPLSATSLRTAVVSHQPPDRRCQPPASGPPPAAHPPGAVGLTPCCC